MSEIKVFVVLYWFWEGDGSLVNKYEDCFLTKDDAMSFANTLEYDDKTLKVYLPNDVIPDENEGGYGTRPFIQIIEKVLYVKV